MLKGAHDVRMVQRSLVCRSREAPYEEASDDQCGGTRPFKTHGNISTYPRGAREEDDHHLRDLTGSVFQWQHKEVGTWPFWISREEVDMRAVVRH